MIRTGITAGFVLILAAGIGSGNPRRGAGSPPDPEGFREEILVPAAHGKLASIRIVRR